MGVYVCQNYQIVPLKCVQFIVHQLYLNEGVNF